MRRERPKTPAAATLTGAAAVALAAGAWPGKAGPMPGALYGTHLCDPAALATSTHCEFDFGAGRRLRLPWEDLSEAPYQCEDLRLRGSDCRSKVASPAWPLRYAFPATLVPPAAEGLGRGEVLPNQQSMVWEEWRRTGLIQADGRVVRGKGELAAGATRFHLRLWTRHDRIPGPKGNLELLLARGWREETTTYTEAKGLGRATVTLRAHGVREGRLLGSGSDRRIFEVTHRADDRFLVRECYEGPRRDVPICYIQGRNGDLSFVLEWSRNSTVSTDEVVAAAASLFDPYLVSGPGLAH